MNRNWRWILPYYLWSLPLTLVGLVLSVLVYDAHAFKWNDGVLTCVAGTFRRDGKTITHIWGRPGAQTFAWLQIYASEEQRARKDLRVHETVHTGQALWFCLGGQALYPVIHAMYGDPWVGVALGGPIGAVAFAATYGACFLYYFAGQGFKDWHSAYRKNPFEGQAYRIGDKGHGWGE